MKLDYRTMTEKDLFMAKLKKEPIHFGFIPIWRLKDFVRFCKEHKLITLDRKAAWKRWPGPFYNVNYDFIYTYTDAQTNFRPLSFITKWLSDILGHYLSKRQQYCLTPRIHCFRTMQRTFNVVGPEYYVIDKKKYIL